MPAGGRGCTANLTVSSRDWAAAAVPPAVAAAASPGARPLANAASEEAVAAAAAPTAASTTSATLPLPPALPSALAALAVRKVACWKGESRASPPPASCPPLLLLLPPPPPPPPPPPAATTGCSHTGPSASMYTRSKEVGVLCSTVSLVGSRHTKSMPASSRPLGLYSPMACAPLYSGLSSSPHSALQLMPWNLLGRGSASSLLPQPGALA